MAWGLLPRLLHTRCQRILPIQDAHRLQVYLVPQPLLRSIATLAHAGLPSYNRLMVDHAPQPLLQSITRLAHAALKEQACSAAASGRCQAGMAWKAVACDSPAADSRCKAAASELGQRTWRASSSFARNGDIIAKQIPHGIQPPTATLKADFLRGSVSFISMLSPIITDSQHRAA